MFNTTHGMYLSHCYHSVIDMRHVFYFLNTNILLILGTNILLILTFDTGLEVVPRTSTSMERTPT